MLRIGNISAAEAGGQAAQFMRLGSLAGTPQYYFNGTIDEVRIYNRSLSASEVAGLYANKNAITANRYKNRHKQCKPLSTSLNTNNKQPSPPQINTRLHAQ